MAYGMEINRGGQCLQDNKGRAKEEGALILLLLLSGKSISTRAQSVDVPVS